MIHPAVIISFFVISVLVGIIFSPLAQLAWLVLAAVGYASAEKFFHENLKKIKVHLPQLNRRKFSHR